MANFVGHILWGWVAVDGSDQAAVVRFFRPGIMEIRLFIRGAMKITTIRETTAMVTMFNQLMFLNIVLRG